MDLSKVRSFVEISDVDMANNYISLGWQCVKIATRCIPVGPGSCECGHVYILGWAADTAPVRPPVPEDDLLSIF